jgi:alpha-D-ribose 1-methylphosphonate 5-triphosphate synthase subunit PhnH
LTDAALVLPRLDGMTSQAAFRRLLTALSEPGRIVQLPPVETAGGGPALTVPLALATPETPLAVLTAGEDPGWAVALTRATGAPVGQPEQAGMVVALRPPTPDEVRILRRGRADAPELGARLVIACTSLADAGGAHAPPLPAGRDPRVAATVELTGPGVPGMRAVVVDGVPVEVFEALVTVNRARPAGVDTFLVDGSGRVVGLPRSTRLTPSRADSPVMTASREGGQPWATRP